VAAAGELKLAEQYGDCAQLGHLQDTQQAPYSGTVDVRRLEEVLTYE